MTRRDDRPGEADRIARAVEDNGGLFNAIFESAAVGIAQLALDGRWLLLNAKVSEILGYSSEELKALTVSSISHPDDLKTNLGHLRRLLTGEVSTCTEEKRFIHKNGSTVWVNLTVTLLRDHACAPACFVAVVEDISERKRAEEELRQSEEKFRKIFGLAPVAITISSLADGRFVAFNDAAEHLSGYRREEVIGRSVYDFGIWSDPEERAEVVREALEQGSVRDREMVMKQKGGGTFWGLFNCVVIEIHGERHLLSLVIDIGEQRRARQALQENEERFRLLADNAPVMIWEAGPDSRCTFVNKAWLNFTGRRLEQELADGWSEGVHPDDLEGIVESYRQAVREGKPFVLEYRLRRKDGGYSWVQDRGIPRFGVDGTLLGYLGTAYDITAERQAKEDLQQANELLMQRIAERTAELSTTVDKLQGEISERIRIGHALEEETTERIQVEAELREKELLLLHQGRLAAMGEMIGNIAHQWRQPLNLLSLLAQELPMVCRKGEFTPDYLDYTIRKMLETIRHMSQTIDDFRDFFRPGKERVEFRVLESVQKTISLLEGSFKAQEVRVTVRAAGDPVLHGHSNELSQVLLNLMVNARDAFHEHDTPQAEIVVEVGQEGERCLITVTDNAGGIPDEIMERIFDPYFTTKAPEKGTGVGLFMSRTIVEKNFGGALTARNVAGGAQFRIVI